MLIVPILSIWAGAWIGALVLIAGSTLSDRGPNHAVVLFGLGSMWAGSVGLILIAPSVVAFALPPFGLFAGFSLMLALFGPFCLLSPKLSERDREPAPRDRRDPAA